MVGSDNAVMAFGGRRSPGLRLAAVLLLVALCGAALLAWGRNDATRTAPSHSTALLSGTVEFATGQVPLAGKLNSGLRSSGPTSVVISGRTAAGRQIVRRVSTNMAGQFSVALPPGRYQLVARVLTSAAPRPLTARALVIVGRDGGPRSLRLVAPNPYVQ